MENVKGGSMKQYIKQTLLDLLNTPSPTGYCQQIIGDITKAFEAMGYTCQYSKKGNLLVEIAGHDRSYSVGLAAHVDTLGLMVRAIKSNGMLAITELGGFTMHSIEGEYVKIHTRDGRVYSGTVLNSEPSSHVYEGARKQERITANMEIRVDQVATNKEAVKALGIEAGDIVSLEPRAQWTDSGYIKSRHLDDKAGVVAVLALLKQLKDQRLTPRCDVKIVISTFEEVGHGSSAIPWQLDEFIAIDMGAIGGDLSCNEQQVSICAKDSSGPYHYDVVSGLIAAAKKADIDYAVDIYPYYGSDISAALRGGNDFKSGLIGPGVHASHHMERTHMDGIVNTINLLKAYLVVE